MMILPLCLVIYAWLVQQDYFKELTDQDVRERDYMMSKKIKLSKICLRLVLFQMALEDDSFVDAEGDRWRVDEYGDRSFMWEYM